MTRRNKTNRRRTGGDAILTILAAAIAIPILALSIIASWESDRALEVEQVSAASAAPTPAPTVQVIEAAYQTARPTPTPAPTPEPTPCVNQRYAGITMTEAERAEMLAVIYLESGNQCPEGQQAVAEVILNRVISPDFPDTVHEVLHQENPVQFTTAKNIGIAEPTQAQEDALEAALYGENILPEDVVFFSRKGENSRVYGKIEDHVFCYGYEW